MRIKRMMMVAVWALATACTDSDSQLYRYASGESLAVASVDVGAVLEDLGCTVADEGVELSPELRTAVGSSLQGVERQRAMELLRMPSIDKGLAVAVVNGEGELLVAATVADHDSVEAWLGALYARDDDGYAVDRLTRVVVSDKEVVVVRSARVAAGAQSVIDRFEAEGAQAPLQPWQREALSTKAHVANVVVDMRRLEGAYHAVTGRQLLPEAIDGYDVAEIADGHAVARLELAQRTATGTLAFFKADGTLVKAEETGGNPLDSLPLAVVKMLPWYVSAEYEVVDGVPTLKVRYEM